MRLGAIETDRLLLRSHETRDAAVHHQLWTERDDRVPARRRIDAEGHPDVDDLAAWIESTRDETGPRLLAVERKDTGQAIGYCGFVFHGNGAADEPEIAYELLRAERGHGFATEAARALIEWADVSGLPRLWATVRDWNAPSRRVLAKLGFRETGEVERDAMHGDSLLTVRQR